MSDKGWWNELYHSGRMFCWDVTARCNYRCPYCWFDPCWDERYADDPLYKAEKWLEAWRRMHDLYGQCRIDIVGGEPFVYPGIEELLIGLAPYHRFMITSNLSLPIGSLSRLCDGVSHDRMHINASFHPLEAPCDSFLEKMRLLRDRGFSPSVLYVVAPMTIHRVMDDKARFEAEGLVFVPLAFNGSFQGRRYPDAFTDEEKRLIASMIDSPHKAGRLEYELWRRPTRGMDCLSGKVFAAVKSNGDVYRCSADRGVPNPPIGNLLDPDFRLFEESVPCPFENCQSHQFVWLKEQVQAINPGIIERLPKLFN